MRFNDARICYQHWNSCASCHQEDATIDSLNWDLINDGTGNPKNVKSLHHGVLTPPAMWSGVRRNQDAGVMAGQRFLGFLPDDNIQKALMEFLENPRRAPNPYRLEDPAAIARFAEDKWQMRRRNALLVFGALAWAIGLLTVFSFNIWSDVHPLGQFEAFAGKTPFDLIDYFTANVMMPLGGILMALFVGWRIKPKVLADDLPFMSTAVFNAWLWMIRVVVPLAILGVLYDSLFNGT